MSKPLSDNELLAMLDNKVKNKEPLSDNEHKIYIKLSGDTAPVSTKINPSIGGFASNIVKGVKNVAKGAYESYRNIASPDVLMGLNILEGKRKLKEIVPKPFEGILNQLKQGESMLQGFGDIAGGVGITAIKGITGKTPSQFMPKGSTITPQEEQQAMEQANKFSEKYSTKLPQTLYNEPVETALKVLPLILGAKTVFGKAAPLSEAMKVISKPPKYGRIAMMKQPIETIIPRLKEEFLEMPKIRGEAYINTVKSYIKPETKVDFSQSFKDLEPTQAGYNKIVKNLPKEYKTLIENPELAESLDPLEAIKIRNSIPYDNGYSGEFRNELAIKVGEAIPEIRTTINPKFKLALADQKAINKFIRESSPDTLYHALTDPEYAIKNPEMAKIIMRNLSPEAQKMVQVFRIANKVKKVIDKIPIIKKATQTRDYFKKPGKK